MKLKEEISAGFLIFFLRNLIKHTISYESLKCSKYLLKTVESLEYKN
jgi:hypothetical protein